MMWCVSLAVSAPKISPGLSGCEHEMWMPTGAPATRNLASVMGPCRTRSSKLSPVGTVIESPVAPPKPRSASPAVVLTISAVSPPRYVNVIRSAWLPGWP